MPIVTNTGPLIALAKIDQLSLLPQLFTSINIPPAVHRELLAKSGADSAQLDAALKQFINIMPKPGIPPAVQVTTQHLEAGEQQAIALAYDTQHTLIIDEKLGRQAARSLGISVSGSVGVLITAKKQGLITAVIPLLKSVRQRGYWLSDELITLAGQLADE